VKNECGRTKKASMKKGEKGEKRRRKKESER
jgi:hypothetical protein